VLTNPGKENGTDTVDQKTDQEDCHGAAQSAGFHGHVRGAGLGDPFQVQLLAQRFIAGLFQGGSVLAR
jgi:hypothetical protein